MRTFQYSTFFLILFVFSISNANTIKVPQDFATIQAAINASTNGDTVLVASGTYYENINFNGKNIVLTSNYGVTGDASYIKNTIINGSTPVHPDTASCVRIISGEDSTAVLQGFTLTNGKGTKWTDEHGAGTFVEGGGIFVTQSSPTIRYNLIVNNEAINSPTGTVSAGGGAIRCGDGSPHIINNVILNNKGMYGAGIVLNYCAEALIANNIINGNQVFEAVSGRQTFGGGGLWVFETLPGNDLPNVIVNNTITGNSSNTNGCGIRVWAANATIKNNIVWNNFQSDKEQINLTTANVIAEYNNVENDIEGTGNIKVDPSFADSSFYLRDNSPCIDAGDPDTGYNDNEDSNSPGNALFPSKGIINNDMGAYGGPMSLLFPEFSSSHLYSPNDENDFGLTLPNEPITLSVSIINSGASVLKIDSASVVQNSSTIQIQNNFPLMITPLESEELTLTWTPLVNEDLTDTLLIYNNDNYSVNPARLILTGSSYPNALISFDAGISDLGEIDASTPRVDTVIYVHNLGTIADSVYTSVIYERVKPDTALEISPVAFEVAPKDSVGITFTFYPPLITKTILSQYQPKLVVDSKFSIGTTHFIKIIKFKLTNVTGVDEITNLPYEFSLKQNYPNPFNPSTVIKYSIAKTSFVNLTVFNVLGEEVKKLIDMEESAGTYQINFNASSLPSGIYFYRIMAGNFVETKKMILLK